MSSLRSQGETYQQTVTCSIATNWATKGWVSNCGRGGRCSSKTCRPSLGVTQPTILDVIPSLSLGFKLHTTDRLVPRFKTSGALPPPRTAFRAYSQKFGIILNFVSTHWHRTYVYWLHRLSSSTSFTIMCDVSTAVANLAGHMISNFALRLVVISQWRATFVKRSTILSLHCVSTLERHAFFRRTKLYGVNWPPLPVHPGCNPTLHYSRTLFNWQKGYCIEKSNWCWWNCHKSTFTFMFCVWMWQ